MDKISRAFDFVVGLNFTFGMYPVLQLKVLRGFKRMGRCALRLVERFWLVKTFVSECLNFN